MAVAVAVLLGACSTLPPSASAPQGSPTVTVGPSSPGSSQVPATAGATSPSTLPPSSSADLHGTITYNDRRSFESEPGLPPESGNDDFSATVNVALTRDPNGSGIEYIDAGSTYTFNFSSHRQREVGVDPVCQVITDWVAESGSAAKAFSDPPARFVPESTITATVDRSLGFYFLLVNISYPYSAELDDCGRIQTIDTTGQSAGGPLACGFLGLTGAYVDVSGGPDEIDMACSQGDADTGTTVTGTLTLED